jgi:hypothetical protein
MSIKVERDTVEKVTQAATAAAPRGDGPLPGTSGKHPIVAAIGTAITGGKSNAGTKGYLMVRNFRDCCDSVVSSWNR